jgi:hypothetical protein
MRHWKNALRTLLWRVLMALVLILILAMLLRTDLALATSADYFCQGENTGLDRNELST